MPEECSISQYFTKGNKGISKACIIHLYRVRHEKFVNINQYHNCVQIFMPHPYSFGNSIIQYALMLTWGVNCNHLSTNVIRINTFCSDCLLNSFIQLDAVFPVVFTFSPFLNAIFSKSWAILLYKNEPLCAFWEVHLIYVKNVISLAEHSNIATIDKNYSLLPDIQFIF